MSPQSQSPLRPPRVSDPFRLLAIVGIIVGLMLVIGAAIVWYATGRQSSLIVGAGMTLAIGGGLRNMLTGLASRMPTYQPLPGESTPPVDPPTPPVPPVPPAPVEGNGTP